MKVVYVGGTCDFCEGYEKNAPNAFWQESSLTVGRAYTVIHTFPAVTPWGQGVGYVLREHRIQEGWGHCSCGFREIDGDAEEWQLLMKKNRPKTKELA